MSFIKRFLFAIQKAILVGSYLLTKPFVTRCNGLWIVGVDEIAAFVHNVASMLPLSLSVSFSSNPFYDYHYNYQLKELRIKPHCLNNAINRVVKAVYGPVLLGYLLNKGEGFFYIWDTAFLNSTIDGRAFEFSFIKKRKKQLICIFVGNDIRSQKLSLEYASENEIDTMATYYPIVAPWVTTEKNEKHKLMIANSADTYADLVFNAPIDQISYLKKHTLPVFYVYPDNGFIRNDLKFSQCERIKVVHAPSSPIIKGTQLVRAAIKKLKVEGFVFDYIELIGVPNTVVIQTLRESHIVLNEFYAFVPGLFGIEAMAAHCALLTSADSEVETTLPPDSEGAWLRTRYWEVYDNLRYLLENPSAIKQYADDGFEWAKRHWAYSQVKNNLLTLIGNRGVQSVNT